MKLLDIMTSPWAILPHRLKEIQTVYETHMRGERIDFKAVQEKVEAAIGGYKTNIPEAIDPGYALTEDGIAEIRITDVLTKNWTFFSFFFGGTAMSEVRDTFGRAVEDPRVKAIVLYIDSPGGTVDGTQDLAGYISANKGGLPVYAYSDGMIASAAYWIAASSDAIYISGDTVEVGSIGVVATHIDQSKWEERVGVSVTEITAGKYKRIASSHAPLSESGRGYIQDQVDYLYQAFVEDVARMRGRSVDQVLEMADGKIFIGRRAAEVGLVDGICSREELINKIQEEITMDLTEFKTKHADLYQAVLAEGKEIGKTEATSEAVTAAKAEGLKEGAEKERQRIKDVEAQAIPGHEALIETMKYDGETTGSQAAIRIVQAEKAANEDRRKSLQADAPPAVHHDNAPPEVGKTGTEEKDNGRPIEQQAKDKWDKDKDLQAEFGGDFDRFMSYAKAEKEGRFRVLSKGK